MPTENTPFFQQVSQHVGQILAASLPPLHHEKPHLLPLFNIQMLPTDMIALRKKHESYSAKTGTKLSNRSVDLTIKKYHETLSQLNQVVRGYDDGTAGKKARLLRWEEGGSAPTGNPLNAAVVRSISDSKVSFVQITAYNIC